VDWYSTLPWVTWEAEKSLVEGGLSNTAAKPECKQNAVALIRDDRDGRHWKTSCYCIMTELGYREMRAFLAVQHEGARKKCLCGSHNIIPTTAPQLEEMITCGTTCTSFALSRPFSASYDIPILQKRSFKERTKILQIQGYLRN
jgi:hypothetical protein